MCSPNISAHLDAVSVTQPHVEHRDVRIAPPDLGECTFGASRLTHNDHVWLGVHELSDTPSYDLVIVEQEKAVITVEKGLLLYVLDQSM